MSPTSWQKCCHDPCLCSALERARVVGVLDACAYAGAYWRTEPVPNVSEETWSCAFMVWRGTKSRGRWANTAEHFGPTPDAARAAAAKAIEAGEA